MENIMSYNPTKYWESRGSNYAGIEDDVELHYMEKAVKDLGLAPDSEILEVGPGYGRIYKLLTGMGFNRTRMCDFVDSMRQECYIRTGIVPQKWDGKTLPYDNDSFDMVVVFDVLLHVPPKDLDNFLKEIKRVSSRLIYVATYKKGIPKLAPHVFEHNYKKRFEDLTTIKEKEFNRPGNGFVATRKHWVMEK
jgi:ubiquinone/menaquinone biosynthesis C-methylase UbiE